MYKTILVPVDLNEKGFSDKAVTTALGVLSEGGTLHLMKVIPGYQMPLVGSFFPEDSFKGYVNEAKKNIASFADSLLSDSGVNYKVYVEEGKASEEILEKCDKLNADCIVMASRKRNKANSLMIGSIANKVLHLSNVPILVVKPTK